MMMKLIRRICPFLSVRHKPLHIMCYLFVVVAILYFVSTNIDIVDVNIEKAACDCVNKSEKRKSNYYSLKQGTELAEETNVKGRTLKTFLLVVVLTGPGNFKRRNAMRSTWLYVTNNFTSVTIRFVVGTVGIGDETRKLLEEEQNMNEDMLLLENFKDDYKQLTRKLLNVLIWISKHVMCSFVMKVDDDTFARLGVILSELKSKYIDIDNLYWGFHKGNARAKNVGKWAEKKWMLCDHYLPYALGGGYIISTKLVQYVANISSLIVLYNSEDVSLAVWLSPLNLTRVHDTRFDTEWRSRGCRNVHIVSHKQSSKNMFDKFVQLRDHNKLCRKEKYRRPSYVYSWDVPPTQCCERKDGIP